MSKDTKAKDSPMKVFLIISITILSLLLALIALVLFGDVPGVDVHFGESTNNGVISEEDVVGDQKVGENALSESGEDTENADVNNTSQQATQPQTCASCQAHQLDLGSGHFVTVPAQWDVVAVVAPYENLTDAEMNDYLQPENIGTWPIEEGLTITIANSSSQISLNKTPIFAAGGIGGTPTPVTGSYDILITPTATSYGIVRYLDNGVYTYYPIQLNASYNPNGVNDLETSMYHHIGLGMGDVVFTFTGVAGDLATADTYVLEACGDNTSGLCY